MAVVTRDRDFFHAHRDSPAFPGIASRPLRRCRVSANVVRCPFGRDRRGRWFVRRPA